MASTNLSLALFKFKLSCAKNAFEMIQEHFRLLPTLESFLDIKSYSKNSNESYRQFYERLLAHVRQHLKCAGNVMVEGITCPVEGDKLTVSHYNMVALMWLRKIHTELKLGSNAHF